MKNRLMKFLVLFFSIAAVSAYVWHATQRKQPAVTHSHPESQENHNGLMLSSSKSAAFLLQEDAKEILGNQPKEVTLPTPVEAPVISDEEVKRVRDNMLRSSKSGMVMSEEDVRKMLEKRAESPQNPPGAGELAPSSKSMRIASPEEVKELAEKVKQLDQKQHKDQQQEQK
jgi:hypothetical protein